MSPARRANGSPSTRKIARQTPIGPTLQTERNAIGPSVAIKKRRDFDPHAFLATIGEGRKSVLFQRKQGIFAQGDAADAVFYIQTGKVKLGVVSKTGKEATVGILGDGDFFGEGSLAGQALRMGSATAITDCAVLRIDKKAMMEALHREHGLSDMFVAFLLARNIRYEEDLVDQLFKFERKKAGPDPSAARSFWQGRHTRDGGSQDQSGDPGRDDRHDSFASQFFHEPV